MANSYQALYPGDMAVSPEIVQFFEDFYRISDIPGEHDQYVDQFTQDAIFILASKKSHGKQEILATRIGMWSAVASRKHTVHKVFPFSNESNEFMLYGSVALGLRNGAHTDVDWAARADIVKSVDGKWRMKFYQVYLDTGAITSPAKS
ncbi:hypothetical protein X797_001382 [Metarhizium robertsii]|uniref:SnoaL-like domain-containing protein n=2 Tax=Metarhizium robertsii TaxID=568076 RepID=E9EXZ4_METRA|nr:uncharacterized protein MAA_04893 [Metarhizium robertsii ARSEF 23]EFY99964.1 hypothetical protein MAA_04893 [Metarhizium robertsii ARSEF 23]EXV06662.1 hypothetical protein X797_001382 [Metarhizium robertsii]